MQENVHKAAEVVVEESVAVTEKVDLDVAVTNASNVINLDILRANVKKTRTFATVAMELDTLQKTASRVPK